LALAADFVPDTLADNLDRVGEVSMLAVADSIDFAGLDWPVFLPGKPA